MWVLLLHLGHVTWTFTAERTLLAEVKRSKAMRRHLSDALPDDEVRLYSRRIIRREDIYRFYHVISFLRLNRLTQNVPKGRLWIAVLKAYCLRTASVGPLAAIYDRLRQIAFIVLDSHYTPAIAGLDLAEDRVKSETFRGSRADPARKGATSHPCDTGERTRPMLCTCPGEIVRVRRQRLDYRRDRWRSCPKVDVKS